jgi:tetratricopeptide (TPR) repeat protein
MIVLTQKQIAVWRNGETLFRHALAVNPNSWMSDNNLAVSIGDRSPDEAIELAHRAIQLRPDLPDAWNTLGSLLMQKGDHLTAIDAFSHAHDITPGNMIFAANLSHAENENRPQKPAGKSPSK